MSVPSVKRSIAPKRARRVARKTKVEATKAEGKAPPVTVNGEAAGESIEALRVKEGVRAGMLRLARRMTRDALRHIEQPASVDRTVDIHQVRVQCKRLRALMRLLRPVADRKVLANENGRLRDAARALSEFRDAFVAGETLKRVFDDTAPRRVKDAAVLLGVQSGGTKRTRDLYAGFEKAAQELREMMAILRKLTVAARGWAAVAPGLERSYRRAQESYVKCRKKHGEHMAECFHEWRKRVKDLAYQLEFLDNVEPTVLKHLRKEFRRLGTMLGEDHDYVVFAEQVRERERHFEHLATFHPVRKRLRRRLKELRAKEFALAGPLLAEPPEMWIARLAGLWLRWKNPKLAATEGPVAPLPATPPAAPEVSIAVTPREMDDEAQDVAEVVLGKKGRANAAQVA